MNRGAWQAIVYEVTNSQDTTEQLSTQSSRELPLHELTDKQNYYSRKHVTDSEYHSSLAFLSFQKNLSLVNHETIKFFILSGP